MTPSGPSQRPTRLPRRPKRPPRAPKRLPRDPQELPRGSQEALKRLPRDPEEVKKLKKNINNHTLFIIGFDLAKSQNQRLDCQRHYFALEILAITIKCQNTLKKNCEGSSCTEKYVLIKMNPRGFSILQWSLGSGPGRRPKAAADHQMPFRSLANKPLSASATSS